MAKLRRWPLRAAPTFGEFMESWLTAVRPSLRPSTWQRCSHCAGPTWTFRPAGSRCAAPLHRGAGGGWTIQEPKTNRSRRPVVLAPPAVRALGEHRQRQAGRPLSSQNVVQRAFQPLLRRLGLPQIRLHDLRHTAATLLLQQGIHPKIVSELLGHTDMGITLDLYSHVTPVMHQAAASALGDLLA